MSIVIRKQSGRGFEKQENFQTSNVGIRINPFRALSMLAEIQPRIEQSWKESER